MSPDNATPKQLSRRAVLAGVSTLPFVAGLPRLAWGQKSAPASAPASVSSSAAGMIVRESVPEHLEMDFSGLGSFVTPPDKFYVRSHFAVPTLDAATWQLKIAGDVRTPYAIGYDELLAMPSETKVVTMECAGNGRVFLQPKADGVQWQLGAVGTAEWTGVPLASVLERAGVNSSAVDVVLEGADTGEPSKPSRPAGSIAYTRSIPLGDIAKLGVLLVYKINGQPLTPAHGYPVRAIVPGWYGMASVKWLNGIVVTAQAYQGFFQTVDYAYWQQRDGLPTRVPITGMEVKSQIARPAFGERVAAERPYRIFGAAWSGNAGIAKVDVSTDGGKSYAAARLLGDDVPHAWRLWDFTWTNPAAGRYALVSRATDTAGRTQPASRDKNRETYMINHLVALNVTVG